MTATDNTVVRIRELINYEKLFEEFLGDLKGQGAERQAFCIWHKNTDTPALGVNVEEGLYLCHNPQCGESGDVFDFYMRVRSLTFPEAVNELARRVGLPENPRINSPVSEEKDYDTLAAKQAEVLANYIAGKPTVPAGPTSAPPPAPPRPRRVEAPVQIIDEAVVESMHNRLLGTPAMLELLATRRGITRETVVRFKLGHDGQRFYIPVRNTEGQCVNIRRYNPDSRQAKSKMISWRQGFGSARLFPLDQLTNENPVYLFEGEMDCLLAQQEGLNALTTTGGAGTWRDAWCPLLEGREVIVCYDADEPGRIGASHVAAKLSGIARSCRIVSIPLNEPVGADFTDYIVGHGHTKEDFLALVASSPYFQADLVANLPALEEEPTSLHLSQASKAEYHNRPVRFNVMVSGKTTSPFLIPREVRVGCPSAVRGTMTMCERCPVSAAGGPIEKRLEFESNDVLTFTNVTDEALKRAVKQRVGVPTKCGYAKHEVLEAMNVEEVQLIPEIEMTEAEAPYVTTAAFYMGHGLKANLSYNMTGVTVPEPKRQLATHLIHTAIESQSNIDAFKLTSDVVSRLRVFNPQQDGVGGLWTQLSAIYDDLERYTRIYQRRDIMLAVDLTFHSVLQFKFQGERLKRGWCEALIIGDSRTGKTSIVQRTLEYYRAGEFSTGENTTLAGLVGGLHQVGTSWALRWGRIPLNDRRLLVIDEAGNLPPEQIARMSSMRSSGIAEVIKVHTERTNARTRQIWISNPRSPRPLSSFSQGVLAVKELIGAPEDIARFDLVVSAASADVPLAIVNAARAQENTRTYTEELCHQRVMWAWSRTAEQVVWENGGTEAVLRLATEQGERYRYATEIPLVEPNEQRVKLARLAVSAACVFFSASDDGTHVLVKPEHVEFAAAFLEMLYSKPSMSFTEYATGMRSRYVLGQVDAIARILIHPTARRSLMEQEMFTQRDIQEIVAINDRDDLRESLTTLRESGFLRRVGSSYYVKTPAAIRWLRERMPNNGQEVLNFDSVMSGTMPEQPPF